MGATNFDGISSDRCRAAKGAMQSLSSLTALSNAKISVASQLSVSKMRRRHGLFIAEGAKCVADTSGAFRLRFAAVLADRIDEIRPLVESGAINPHMLFTVTLQQMRKISSLSTLPSLIAVFEIPDSAVPAPERGRLYPVLDGVQDPGNLGTIIRTADWFGYNTIYASHDTADIYNPKAVQATMGSLHRVNVHYCDILTLMAESGMPVYGTLLDGKDIFSTSLGNEGFMVFGSEGKGLSSAARNLVTSPLLIPPHDADAHPDSLNVGVAAAIVMSAFRHR